MSFLITTDNLNNHHLPFAFNSSTFEFDFPSPSLSFTSSTTSSSLSPTALPDLTPQNSPPASDFQSDQCWLFGNNFGQDITMADLYRGRSRQSESPSCSSSSGGSQHGSPHYRHGSSHSSGHSNLSHAPVNSGQYAYYPSTPSPGQEGPLSSSHTYYAPSHGHQRTSSSGQSALPRHQTYPGPAAHPASERASKRQRASTADHAAYSQTQWADTSDRGQQSIGRQSERKHPASRQQSSGSSGYTSPGYSHGDYHDPYGQQLLQPPSTIPGVGPSTMRDAHVYMRQSSRHPPSDDEAEHGPTELPPRTYSGKSPYDQPKKPGKIPGSAMDYLPILEARFDRLENAVDRYVEYRGQRALSNSILPGMEEPEGSSARQSSSSSRYSRGSSRR